MSKVSIASAQIAKLSARHGVDPLAVTGLLALYALVEVDFAKLALWRRVGAALVEDARG
jgi:hypothetical protein